MELAVEFLTPTGCDAQHRKNLENVSFGSNYVIHLVSGPHTVLIFPCVCHTFGRGGCNKLDEPFSLFQGLVDISILTVAAGATSALFFKVNPTAGLLMVPYLAWLGVATSLNYWIYHNNPKDAIEGGDKQD